MSRVTKFQLSEYRKKIATLLKKLGRLATRCLYLDSIIRATPSEVYRKCGKKNCKCVDIEKRHGPYRVITAIKDGNQKQFSLRKNENEIWEKVIHYKFQMNKLMEFKRTAKEISDLISEVIEKRTEEFKKNEYK